jgi:hypothetical protein
MATAITAVAKLYQKTPSSDASYVQLNFQAAYDDERNRAWSKYTPSLSVGMNVLPEVAEQFELNANYVLTFEKQEPWHG